MSDTPFEIDIQASRDPNKCTVSAVGMQMHTISDVEQQAFRLYGDGIKQAIGSLMGRAPDSVWLHDPTPGGADGTNDGRYNNCYSLFGWTPVTTTLRVISAIPTGINSHPVIANHTQWDNHTDHVVHYSAGMSIQKSETASHSWTNGDKVTVGGKFTMKIGVEGFGDIGSESSWNYEHTWSDTKTESNTITVGVTASAASDVPAGRTETAYLFSYLGSATYRVTYQASLSGLVAFQYRNWYSGHRYYGYDVRTVLGRMGVSDTITITQDINVGFYSDAIVEVDPGPYDPNKQPSTRLLLAAGHLLAAGPTR